MSASEVGFVVSQSASKTSFLYPPIHRSRVQHVPLDGTSASYRMNEGSNGDQIKIMQHISEKRSAVD